MQFFVTYETDDGNGEVEKEFNTLAKAIEHIAALDGLLQWHSIYDENGQIDPFHYCTRHNITTGEGDICHKCEEHAAAYVAALNVEMAKHQYALWFVCSKQALFQCPVSNFDQAKLLYLSLSCSSSVTGVRIARYDPEQGCESVLHKFH